MTIVIAVEESLAPELAAKSTGSITRPLDADAPAALFTRTLLRPDSAAA